MGLAILMIVAIAFTVAYFRSTTFNGWVKARISDFKSKFSK